MFVDFNCNSNEFSLNDCYIPSGVTTELTSTQCTPRNVLSIECTRKEFECGSENLFMKFSLIQQYPAQREIFALPMVMGRVMGA